VHISFLYKYKKLVMKNSSYFEAQIWKFQCPLVSNIIIIILLIIVIIIIIIIIVIIIILLIIAIITIICITSTVPSCHWSSLHYQFYVPNSGSLCAERNVIGSALSQDITLKRRDLKMIAVYSVNTVRSWSS